MRTHEGSLDVEDARATVEWYFGDLLEAEVRESPVSRDRLVRALARLHVAATRRRGLLCRREGRVSHRGPTETVVVVPEATWETLVAAQEIASPAAAAAGRVHRRMAVALAAAPEDADRRPLVLAEPP